MQPREQVEALRKWAESALVRRYGSAAAHGSESFTDELARPSANAWVDWESDERIAVIVDCTDYRCVNLTVDSAIIADDDDLFEFETGSISVQYSDDHRPFRDDADERFALEFIGLVYRFGAESAAEIAITRFINGGCSG